ncbi:hypothetical protein [Streptomyces sp. B6B3]|uniref:hypothetical protein n=1 Tax=Streptomyces sp. B6B3 TaxID=3153570 RepID=UPI00325D7B02
MDPDVEPLCEPMSERLVERVRAPGGDVTSRLHGAGRHTWPYWERELHAAFPMLVDTATADRRGA